MSWKDNEEVTAPQSLDQHRFSDVDDGARAQHHTLGTGQNQAAPGRFFRGLKQGFYADTLDVTTNGSADFTFNHGLKVKPKSVIIGNQNNVNWLIFRIISTDSTQVTVRCWNVPAGGLYTSTGPFKVTVLVIA